MEIWKDILGYEGVYQVSNNGQVKRIKKYRSNPGILTPAICKSGYMTVSLWKDNKGASHYIHRLVCTAFHSTPASRLQCNHKDGNRINNSANNLEWITPRENERHAIANLGKSNAGERNGQAKLTVQHVVEMRTLYETGHYTHQRLADTFNISRRQIGRIVNKKAWKHI